MSVNEKMTAIANAIRGKTGGTEAMTLDGMAGAIAGIAVGGGASLDDITVLIADYSDGATYAITEGAYYGTKRAIVTI